MVIYMHNLIKPYILVFDIEYDKQQIIQISGILLQNIRKGLYQINRSINIYINNPHLSSFVQNYTNITQEFLDEYGVDLDEAHQLWKEFLEPFDPDDVLVVSHGIYQDSLVLRDNGFDIEDYEHWCTYNMAKWVLDRDDHLTLNDICAEMGYSMLFPHNAYADALANVFVYSFLLKPAEEDL